MLSADQDNSVREPKGVLAELTADLTEDGRYGERIVRVTKQAVTVSDPNGAVLATYPVSDLESAKNDSLVSGGRLILRTKNHEDVVAASYSLTHANQFGELARGIEQLAKGSELEINLLVEKIRCPKCGKLLPEKDGVCPSCINRGKTLLRLGAFLKPYKAKGVLLALFATCSTLLALVPPKIQGTILDNFNAGTRDTGFLLKMVGLWALVLVALAGLQVLSGRLNTWLGAHLASDLRTKTYRSIEFLTLNYFDKKPVGAIASRVTQDTDRVWFFLVDGLPFLVINGFMLCAVAAVIFAIKPMLALMILAPIPLVGFISVKVWKPISNLFFRASQKMARVHMHLNESLMGIRVVKAFAKEDDEFQRFKTRSEELRNANVRADQTWHTAFGVMTLAVSLGTVIHWLVGGTMLFKGELTFGQFYMIHAYLGMVYGPLQWFASVNNWFSRAMAGAERIFEIMDMKQEPAFEGGKELAISGAVEFKDVRFGYDKSNPVINGVSFNVKAGEMIGLVGHSGAGKSTTINLVSRFYEPDQGQILIDGVDYRELDLRHYRNQIGIVLQEPFLFAGTIADNIKYGNADASMEEVMEAAKAANAHDFILGKSDGYDTVVGERGSRLSGGEKQRISIARAILHNPRILILDEATSSVDVETERKIQEAILNLIKGRTTFAIAHRLSTLRNADRLFVLDRGQVVEEGTHEELMDKKGKFYDLVQTQSAVNEIIGIGTV
ncbi:MAG: ATP-binding cassette domain-containing protein [Armatimonadetes bacterium]|nr:ATP-binding cassette domain-containing protein [Armatimonadota bacterium]MBS1712331.1 ATP-binding cassette domain-containing protein [Armatimonadota bacterium]MBX3108039.1 ATP-binding cassette domain-containing protein [Fimbriimonadaceae bacterium]